MSAILSVDDLNDFISPGVACIKPVEMIPEEPRNPYEVTTEDKIAASQSQSAPLSLTDCLACSGCVTSAEAMLVSLQSHDEVLRALDEYASLKTPWEKQEGVHGSHGQDASGQDASGKLFVASVSPQVRASLAAVFRVSEAEAGNMIAQLLSGPFGLGQGGANGSHFTWVLDTNVMREACLVAAADEVANVLSPEALNSIPKLPPDRSTDGPPPRQPILTSACPGWICYVEKTHPYLLPHLSRLKSPQALMGTLIKSVMSRRYGVSPSEVWHLAIMPCFDKKLEASRGELTSSAWLPDPDSSWEKEVRDVDCVITGRELLHLASARGIHFASLPRTSLRGQDRIRFPDRQLDAFLFPASRGKKQVAAAGSSGGFLYHILQTYQAQHAGSSISVSRGRNADVVEYAVVHGSQTIVKAARFYGFRNIQNLVRRLKPAKTSKLPGSKAGTSRRPGASVTGGKGEDKGVKEYAYVEVMACPGGCTNGGGQIQASAAREIRIAEGLVREERGETEAMVKPGPQEQKEWLAQVDEAYFSASDSHSNDEGDDGDDNDTAHPGSFEAEERGETSRSRVEGMLSHWEGMTGIERRKLIYTHYTDVSSTSNSNQKAGKGQSDVERVAGLAASIGGGW